MVINFMGCIMPLSHTYSETQFGDRSVAMNRITAIFTENFLQRQNQI